MYQITRIDHLIPVDLIRNLSSLKDPIVEVLRLRLPERKGGGASVTREFIELFINSVEANVFLSNPEGSPGIFFVDAKKPLQGLHAFGIEAAQRIEELLSLKNGDVMVVQTRKRAPFSGGSTSLGNLRVALHQKAVGWQVLAMPEEHNLLWVTDFPLFSPASSDDDDRSEAGQGGTAGFRSTHHPFTAPRSPADIDLLLTDPASVRADHYDLVLNGVELGGGSRRIHDVRVQQFILQQILQISPSRLDDFTHLLEVLRAGCPPHAGFALGFDRLVSTMLRRPSIRHVIAFPKYGRGEEPLVRSPSSIPHHLLHLYHLVLDE